jgi:hypothetical protein
MREEPSADPLAPQCAEHEGGARMPDLSLLPASAAVDGDDLRIGGCVDGGMGDNLEPSPYGQRFTPLVVGRWDAITMRIQSVLG